MRSSKVVFASLVFLISLGVLSSRVFCAQSKQEELESLFAQMQHYHYPTSDQAAEQLLKLAKSDPEARKFLVARLPGVIERANAQSIPAIRVFENEVRLVGDLQIVEASGALAQKVQRYTSVLASMGFEQHEVIHALVEIGEPAVSAVIEVLQHGNADQRKYSAVALGFIGSREAQAALRDALARETDPEVRGYLEKALDPPDTWTLSGVPENKTRPRRHE
jgi:HEAT repeat protein